MKIKILKEEAKKLEFEIKGESHTLCNALRKKLWESPEVDVAVYKIVHPAASNPIMLLELNKGNPRKILTKAVDSLQKDLKSFSEEILKNFEYLSNHKIL
jgi:DNA-directed RNA polymerase subunit L